MEMLREQVRVGDWSIHSRELRHQTAWTSHPRVVIDRAFLEGCTMKGLIKVERHSPRQLVANYPIPLPLAATMPASRPNISRYCKAIEEQEL